jgi:hypothetical protein
MIKTLLTSIACSTLVGVVGLKAQLAMSVTNGLVAYYPMHGDATEATGHGTNGMLMGSPQMATNRFGQPMQALAFNGGMDGMMLTNLNVDLATNAENTVCFWMSWNGQPGGAANPVSMPFGWGDTNGAYCLLFQGTNSGSFGFSMGMGDVYGMSSAMMAPNTWTHIAAVFNNGTTTGSQLYVNGQPMTGMMSMSGMPMGIGRAGSASHMASVGGTGGQTGNGYQFFGMMSDLLVYDRALEADEITGIYRMEAGSQMQLMSGMSAGTGKITIGSMMTGWKFQMQSSADLIHWTNQGGMFLPGSGGTNFVTVDMGGQGKFFRTVGSP